MTATYRANGLQAALTRAVAAHKVPGAVFAIFHDGQLHVAAAGVLNAGTGHPVTPGSLFQIGSITKVFTATLVMQLVEQGRLALDAPLVGYLPEFRCADREARAAVTIRQLLTHTSGLDGDFFTDTGSGEDCVQRYVERCALLPQAHRPGAGLSYSNSAYVLAGRLLEVMYGRSWDRVIQQQLFQPLGMARSATLPAALVGHDAAIGHSADPQRDLVPVPHANNYGLPMSGSPAGATATMSAGDLVTFVRAHLANGCAPNGVRILREDTARSMREPQAALPWPARDITAWGIGWMLTGWGDQRLFGHDGGTSGQSAFLRVHAPSGTIATLLANCTYAHELMTQLFAEHVEPLVGAAMPAAPQPSGQPVADLQRYCGTYRTVGSRTEISLADGRLERRHAMFLDEHTVAEPAVLLEHVAGDTFLFRRSPQGVPTTVTFLAPDAEGRPTSLFCGVRLARRDPVSGESLAGARSIT